MIASAYFAYSAEIVYKALNVLGKDSSYYENMHREIVRAFQKRFKEFKTQTECAIALSFGLAQNKKETAAKLANMVKDAKIKADSITAAANDSVQRQQVLFDKLKLEVAAFKSAVTSKYKEHLSILQEIPDAVQMDPERMAQVITAKLNDVPSPESFISPVTETRDIDDNGFSVKETEEE